MAEQIGTDRIEFYCALKEWELTPGFGTLLVVCARIALSVHPVIRPCDSDFCYNPAECEMMINNVAQVRNIGLLGLVIRLLDAVGHIDLVRMRCIMHLAGIIAVTFHRAFDMCFKPYQASRKLTALWVSRILSSGQQQSAETGLVLLKKLSDLSHRLIFIAGAGMRLPNLHKFVPSGI